VSERPFSRRLALAGLAAALALTTAACAVLPAGDVSPTPVNDRPSTEAPAPSSPPTVEATQTAAPAEPTDPSTSSGATSAHPTDESGTALAQLTTLIVAGRAPMTGYDRDRFGPSWLDADRNGCDTRNDILRRDLHDVTLKAGTGGCVVLTGMLTDPYTRARIEFVRGDTDAVDIDHVVAVGNAWASGAWRSDIRKRAALANDPLNLLAVDAGTNRSKGDSNAASWLPPNKAFRCTYVARQVAVKAKYRLTVTDSEKAQMTRQLGACPGWPATPDQTHAPTRVDQNISDPGVTPTPAGREYFENCDAARAAGAAPVHRGDPGYGRHLDRDGDGSACE
jgi:hypothetical protein